MAITEEQAERLIEALGYITHDLGKLEKAIKELIEEMKKK